MGADMQATIDSAFSSLIILTQPATYGGVW
jgi:hypothetical protein